MFLKMYGFITKLQELIVGEPAISVKVKETFLVITVIWEERLFVTKKIDMVELENTKLDDDDYTNNVVGDINDKYKNFRSKGEIRYD